VILQRCNQVTNNAMSDVVGAQYRLFVAVMVPEEVKAEIERAQAELRRALPEARVTWTRPEQFHLTLKFLAHVEAQRVGELVEAACRSCGGFAALRLRAEGVGCFPDARFPRVVWVGVRDEQDQLPRLQRAVEAAAGSFSAEARPERFSGHVTLGRIKGLGRPEAEGLARLAGAMAERFFGQWTADRLEIMRSELSPKGARHTSLATVALGARPGAA
jgi:2'-5' RNA ligase